MLRSHSLVPKLIFSNNSNRLFCKNFKYITRLIFLRKYNLAIQNHTKHLLSTDADDLQMMNPKWINILIEVATMTIQISSILKC